MRRFLTVTTAVTALLGANTVQAQWAVIDSANLMNTARTVSQGAQQIRQLQQQILTMTQQLQQMQSIYGSVAHLPDSALQQLGQTLNTQQFRNVLPSSSGSLSSIMNGSGLGTLGNLGNQYLTNNRVYAPSGSDFNATSMNSNANSIAGVQALSDAQYQSVTDHMQALQGLEAQLANAPDEKAVGDISARLQTEQTYIQGQMVQAQTIATWQAAEVRSEDQRRQEQRRQNIDDVIQKAASHTVGPS